ncbi:hypothetical protein CDAR_293961 [Caerostris darwini]|uniref:Uncharacterized protein n=1 Tax=Caerostris darwini TaxID=1538125 RepID=A0AAV4VG34_9ARAC|nr:hypothetical protein CDAR_293961 [Caerostris darwini]
MTKLCPGKHSLLLLTVKDRHFYKCDVAEKTFWVGIPGKGPPGIKEGYNFSTIYLTTWVDGEGLALFPDFTERLGFWERIRRFPLTFVSSLSFKVYDSYLRFFLTTTNFDSQNVFKSSWRRNKFRNRKEYHTSECFLGVI